MKLPHLFHVIHGEAIFRTWLSVGQPPFVTIIPQEPFGLVSMRPDRAASATVPCIQIRCWNDGGVMRAEAASAADLKVAQDWAARHKDTDPREFKWWPDSAELD